MGGNGKLPSKMCIWNALPGDFCCFLAQELPVKLRGTLQVISEHSKPKPIYFNLYRLWGLGCRGELWSLTELTKGWEFVFPLEAKSEGNSLYFYKQEHWRCCTSWGEQFTSRSFKMWTHLQGSDTSVQINTHFSEQPKEMKLNTMQWNTAVTFRECSVIEQLKIKMGNQLFLKYL